MLNALLLTAFLLCCGICDLRTGRIPNWLTACGMVTGLFFCSGLRDAIMKLLFAGAVFAFGSLRLIGMGDIKMLMASVLLAGFLQTCVLFLLAAGLMALALAARGDREALGEAALPLSALLRRERPPSLSDGSTEPFAPYLFLACLSCTGLQAVIGGLFL